MITDCKLPLHTNNTRYDSFQTLSPLPSNTHTHTHTHARTHAHIRIQNQTIALAGDRSGVIIMVLFSSSRILKPRQWSPCRSSALLQTRLGHQRPTADTSRSYAMHLAVLFSPNRFWRANVALVQCFPARFWLVAVSDQAALIRLASQFVPLHFAPWLPIFSQTRPLLTLLLCPQFFLRKPKHSSK